MAVSRTLGTLSPVVYFVNHRDPRHPEGYLMPAPYSSMSTPEGYSRHEACTLREVDALQRRLYEQAYREREAALEKDDAQWRARLERVNDSLYASLASSSTSEYEKEFIRLYLRLRDDKRERYRQRFMEFVLFNHARENDLGDRRADEETVRLDRIDVQD